MTGPRWGAVLQLEAVDLPEHERLPAGGSGPERERWRRDNVARRCWRLVSADGSSAGVGLFVSADLAREFARENRWTVLPGTGDESRK